MSSENKAWMVMIYLAADNNLSAEGVWALTEIERVWQEYRGRKPELGILVLFDTNVVGVETKVFEFVDDKPLTPDPAPRYGKIMKLGTGFSQWVKETNIPDNASSPAMLKAFVQQVGEQYPAQNYALILSGHGSGAVGDFLKSGKDNLSGTDYKGMSIPNLAAALKEIIIGEETMKISLLGMDSCLMSMAEVGYELPNNIGLMMGSEGSEPLTGWPYHRMLQLWLEAAGKHPTKLSVEEMARHIRDVYIEYYSDYYEAGVSVDIASVELGTAKKATLRNAVKELATKLTEEIQDDGEVKDAIILSHWRAQSYKAEHYTDLWDFCDILQKELAEKETIFTLCQSVKDAIEEMAESRYYGPASQHSHGLSVYFPWRESEELLEYDTLQFAQDTDWGVFLKKYVDVTRREKRGESKKLRGQYVEGAEFIPTSYSQSEAGISGLHKNTPPHDKNTPPHDKNTPPHDKNTPPHDKNTPPHDKNTPPHDKNTPPHDKGMLLATMSSMRNPPNGFLVDKNGAEIESLPVK